MVVELFPAQGAYWRNPTKAPCESVGTKRFRLPNSTDDIPNSADIPRGYKSGYNIIQTAGKGDGL